MMLDISSKKLSVVLSLPLFLGIGLSLFGDTANGLPVFCENTRRLVQESTQRISSDVRYHVSLATDTHIFAYFEPDCVEATDQAACEASPAFTFDSCHDGKREHPNFRILDDQENQDLKDRLESIEYKLYFGSFDFSQVRDAIHRNTGVFRNDYHVVTNNCANRVIGVMMELNAEKCFQDKEDIHSYVVGQLVDNSFSETADFSFDAQALKTLYTLRGEMQSSGMITAPPDSQTIMSDFVAYTMISESICGSRGLFHLDLSSDWFDECPIFTGGWSAFDDTTSREELTYQCSQFCVGGSWGNCRSRPSHNDYVCEYVMNGRSPWLRMFGPKEGTTTELIRTPEDAEAFCANLYNGDEFELASYSDLCTSSNEIEPFALAHLSQHEIQNIRSDGNARWIAVYGGDSSRENRSGRKTWTYIGNDPSHGPICGNLNPKAVSVPQDHTEYVLCKKTSRDIPVSDREECEIDRSGTVITTGDHVFCSFEPSE